MNLQNSSLALICMICLSATAAPSLSVSYIKGRNLSDALPLGQISYAVYEKDLNGNWTVEMIRKTLQVGDCSNCSRGIAIIFAQLNGDANNLKQLGASSLDVLFDGDQAANLEYEVSSSGDLVRNGAAAKVGMSLNSLKFIPSAFQPQEIVFTTEDSNPFDTEHVGPGTSTSPITHKLVIEPIK